MITVDICSSRFTFAYREKESSLTIGPPSSRTSFYQLREVYNSTTNQQDKNGLIRMAVREAISFVLSAKEMIKEFSTHG